MQNINDLIRQAGIMQNKLANLQKEMSDRTVEATSGGGMVKVVATCRQEIKSIIIESKVVEQGDIDMIQDLVLTAVNEALRISRTTMENEMSVVTGGVNLPGML